MAANSRVAKALKAMKEIGILEEIVKPVLKNLVDLYDNNWELIEDDHYRVLIDAIFDDEDSKREERNLEYLFQDEPGEWEAPPKTSGSRSQPDQSSTSSGDANPGFNGIPLRRMLNQEDNKVSQTCCKQKVAESTHFGLVDKNPKAKTISPLEHCIGKGKKPSSPQSCFVPGQTKPSQLFSNNRVAESDPLLPQAHLKDNEEAPVSLQIVRREKRLIDDRGNPNIYYKKPKVLPGGGLAPKENVLDKYHNNDIIQKSEEFIPDLPQFEVPLAIVPPAPSTLLGEDGHSNRYCSNIEGNGLNLLESKHLDTENEDDGDSLQFDIASSLNGEVKISLICNSARQSDYHIPSLSAVLKSVEERYLKSFKIIEPGFSLSNLMKDICECFLAEGTHSTDEEHAGSITVTPSLDVSQKSNALVVLHGRGDREDNFFIPPSFLNGSVRSQNLIEVPPQFPGLVSLNGSNPIHCSTGSKTTGNPYCATEKKTKEQKGVGSSNSSAMVLFQKHHSSLDPLKHPQYLDDITRGEENVTISLINGITNDCLPTFYYIPRNIVYRNAYVKFILARISDENCCSNCFGDCMSLAIPCACAGETGGEFAYTPEGLVEEKFLEKCIAMNRDPQQHGLFYCKDCPLERSKDKSLSGPCKGHLVRKFIKECWYKCGCSIKCGNRVVQRGITVSMQVFMTPERKGWGLRTLEDLPKGAFICEYVGEIVTNMELYERNVHGSSNDKHTYPVLLDADWGSEGVLKDEEALCLDATSYGNVARFINHRCFDANLVEIPVEVETPDHHYYHLAFFTRRRVDAFEELTWDYGIDFNDHSHPVKAFQCQCGSKLCRGIKRQKRTKFSS